MKILKKLFSHGFLVTAIVIAVVVYYYRDRLFPAETEQAAVETVSTANAGAAEQVSEPPEGKKTVEEESLAAVQLASAPAEESETPRENVGPGTSTESAVVIPEAEQSLAVDEQPFPEQTLTDSIESELSAENTPTAAVQAPAAVPVATEAPAEDAVSRLNRARNAFWSGNYQEAERLYSELLAENPDNPDIHGELGNVYYAQGKWPEAGESYYNAAHQLVKLGYVARANYLQRIIAGLDAEKAKLLDEEIEKFHGNFR